MKKLIIISVCIAFSYSLSAQTNFLDISLGTNLQYLHKKKMSGYKHLDHYTEDSPELSLAFSRQVYKGFCIKTEFRTNHITLNADGKYMSSSNIENFWFLDYANDMIELAILPEYRYPLNAEGIWGHDFFINGGLGFARAKLNNTIINSSVYNNEVYTTTNYQRHTLLLPTLRANAAYGLYYNNIALYIQFGYSYFFPFQVHEVPSKVYMSQFDYNIGISYQLN